MTDVLEMLGEHLEEIRPSKKPGYAQISAAKAAASVVDSYLSTILTCMDHAKRSGQEESLPNTLMEISDRPKKVNKV
jgi:hypothetical protein